MAMRSSQVHEDLYVALECLKIFDIEMFVRMLTVHCDQNNSYEITINGFQVRKINENSSIVIS